MPSSEIIVRRLKRAQDLESLNRLDTTFSSDQVYTIETDNGLPRLACARVNPPVTKVLPLDFSEDLTDAFVATSEGVIRGLIATNFETWNRRLVVTHFYVDRPYRRLGIGRKLLNHALNPPNCAGAVTVWIETSNLNYPAVEAYRRLGFSICGFDETHYRGTPSDREFALFLARPLNQQKLPTNPS